jgi:predicted ferric reductase
MYEVFLAIHQILAALVLITAFLHIYYLYAYDWGYEIWIYVAGGIWFLERVIRLIRIAAIGKKIARVTMVDEGSDLLRVEVDGVAVEGHVYLFFPSLNWRIWESHPFSVLSSFTGGSAQSVAPLTNMVEGEKRTEVVGQAGKQTASSSDDDVSRAIPVTSAAIRPQTVLLIRPQSGTTKQLFDRTRAAGGSLSSPIYIEASYHASPSLRSLTHCSTIIGIAGGVGITAIVPIVRTFGGSRAHIFWGVKHDDIVRAIAPEIRQLEATGVSVETSIGTRMEVKDVVREEVLGREDTGPVGIVVCGPPSMADDVRRVIGEVVGGGKAKREVVFVDETFNW